MSKCLICEIEIQDGDWYCKRHFEKLELLKIENKDIYDVNFIDGFLKKKEEIRVKKMLMRLSNRRPDRQEG